MLKVCPCARSGPVLRSIYDGCTAWQARPERPDTIAYKHCGRFKFVSVLAAIIAVGVWAHIEAITQYYVLLPNTILC